MALTTSLADRPFARSACGFEIHLHLALLAAEGKGGSRRRRRSPIGCAGWCCRDRRSATPASYRSTAPIAKWARSRRYRTDEGRRRTRRRKRQLGLRHRGYLREGQILIDIRLEEILDHRRAVDRLRFRVLDVVDGGFVRCARRTARYGSRFPPAGYRCSRQSQRRPGILMFGKMSVAVLSMAYPPIRTIRTANMMNVYGR